MDQMPGCVQGEQWNLEKSDKSYIDRNGKQYYNDTKFGGHKFPIIFMLDKASGGDVCSLIQFLFCSAKHPL